MPGNAPNYTVGQHGLLVSNPACPGYGRAVAMADVITNAAHRGLARMVRNRAA